MLVPPAPRAFSNSDLVIWPSPLVSICENRSCRALAGLVAAGAAAPVDDWLCAASNALKVVGDTCGPAPNPGIAVEPPEGGAETSNGSPEAGPKPIGCDDDGLDEVSDLMASTAADAAPKASSITELRQMPHSAAPPSIAREQQPPSHRKKSNEM